MKRPLVFGTIGLALAAAGCLDLATANTTAGGAGAGGSGGSGGGSSAVIQEWSATAPQGTLPYTLPDWLRIECPTGNRTSQWGIDTLQRGFGPNAARPRNVGLGWGLSVESRRRNQIKGSDSWNGTTWNESGPALRMKRTEGQTDPAGGSAAVKFDSTGNQRSSRTSVPQGYASAWLMGTGMPPLAHFVIDNGGASWGYHTLNEVIGWRRYSAGIGSGGFLLSTEGNALSGASAITEPTTIHAFGAQHETDGNGSTMKYPSSYIPTADTDVTRDADSLYSDSANELIPGGYFHAIVKFAPNYASNEWFSKTHQILYLNTTNHVRLDLDKGKLVLECAGSILTGPTSGALSWDRETELTVEVKVTPRGRWLSVSGAKGGNFEVSDVEDRAWPSNGRVYILGDTSGAQECADLRYIGFFAPNE